MEKRKAMLSLSSIGQKVQVVTEYIAEALSVVAVLLLLSAIAIGAVILFEYGTEPIREYIALTVDYWSSFPLPGIQQG